MRIATCRCGALQALCSAEPARVSICHCQACQRRTGSAFSAQVRFELSSVTITGNFKKFERTGDTGGNLTYQFCPECGSTIAYQIDTWPDLLAVPLGAFADMDFPAPSYSIYERGKHPWVSIIGEGIAHFD